MPDSNVTANLSAADSDAGEANSGMNRTDAAKRFEEIGKDDFAARLDELSTANARAQGSTIIDEPHVKSAVSTLLPTGQRDQIKGQLGTLFMGAGLGELIRVIAERDVNIISFTVCVIALPLGTMLFGMSMRRWPR